MGRTRYARSLSAFLLVAVTALFSLPSVTTSGGGRAEPGSEDRLSLAAAGVPEAGIPLFTEDFSNQDAAATGVSILSYTGSSGMTYTADTQYTPAGGQCNGWVMSSTTALPTTDAGCANNQPDGWNQLRAMAADLGLAQGQTAAQAAANQVLTEYTNAPSGAIAAGYELKTNAGIPAVAGHYYAVSAYFAEVNCQSNHASMTFSLVINGAPTVLSSGLDPCTAAGGTTYPTGTRVVKLQSAAIQMPPTGTPSLGLQLYNARANGNGNDVSFDLPQIVDVTPSLDKAFSPTTVTSCPAGAATCPPSSVSTLTFTVTNTTDLQAKPDWNFTDDLPAGVRVAPTPNVGGTCTSTTGAALVRTAAAGSTSISVTGGDLALGQASCTVTVDVVSATPGTYTNDATNVTTNLVPPDPAVLTVVDPSTIRVQKDLPDGRRVASDQFTVSVTGGGITTGNTGTTAGTDTGVQATAAETAGPARGERGTTYTVTETAAAGAQLSDYTSTWRCVDTANGDAVVASGNGATGTFTMPTAPVRSDVLCTFTNVPKLPDINIKKTAGAAPVISGPDAAGNYTVKYQVTVTNSGDGNGSYGALVDTPAFSANLTPLGATWTTSGAGAPAGGSDASAPYALTSGTTSIGAGVTHTYDMVLTFRFTDGKPATTCAGSGTGLFNAVAAASGETGTTADNSACVNPPQPPTTKLVLDKRVASVSDVNGNGLTDAGDTIQWEFDLTNQSQVTLTDLKVADPLAGSATCAATTLAPGATTTCTADAAYVITAADVQAGSVENIATSTGEAPWGDPATPGDDVRSNDDSTITPLDQTTKLVLDKRVASVTDVNANGITDAGDTVQWEFELTNESNVTLTDLTVSDPLAGSVTCVATTLAPGASTLCTADAAYVITAADVTAGEVLNTATAKGEGPGGDPNDPSDDVPSNPDTTRTPVEAVDTELVLDKRVSSVTDVNGNGLTDLGDEIQWEFELTNNSNVTLTHLAVSDPLAGPVTCAVTTLAPGASTTCTADDVYVITQADVDAGKVVNTATAKGEAPGGDPNDPKDDVPSNPDTTTTPVDQKTALLLDKRVASVTDVNGNGLTDLGDEIQWEFELTNTGTVTLTDLKVVDPLAGPVTCAVTTLAPGASTTCTADDVYVITQADMEAGSVDNRATSSGEPPGGDPNDPKDDVPSNPDTTTTPVDQKTALLLDKRVASVTDVNGNGLTDLGDEIQWEFELTNNSNVTLTHLAVSDPLAGPVTCAVTTLAPGASTTCTADAVYVITQADMEAGSVDNVATSKGEGPKGDPNDPKDDVVSPPDDTTTPVDQKTALLLDKRVSSVTDVNGNGLTDLGDEIQWEFELTNNSNVTLTHLAVSDPLAGPVTCAVTTLAPGASTTCTADAVHVITQADVDAGKVVNTATAKGEGPKGDPNDPSDDVPSNPDTTTTPVEQVAKLSLDKRVASVTDVNGNGRTDLGDEISWEFELTNIGTVTLTDLAVSDPLAGAVTCSPSTVAPGASVVCTADKAYVITQADVDAGSVDNVATAKGEGPKGDPNDPKDDVTTPPDTTSTPVEQVAKLSLDKRVASVTDVNGNGRTDLGDEINYEFELTNIGTVTLTDLAVSDPLAGAVTCSPSTVAPGASVVCTADKAYVITQADVDAGSVDNVATAKGEGPKGDPNDPKDDVTTPPDTTSTPVEQVAKLSLDKRVASVTDVNGNGRTDLGDEISWEFELTNIGNVTLTDLAVSDPLAGAVTCAATTLAPGASTTCTADKAYVITQADVDAGSVDNVATAKGEGPKGDPNDPKDDVVSPPDTTSTPVVVAPGLVLDKRVTGVEDANGNGQTDAGDEIGYAFKLTNTGNVTLRDLTVQDSMLADAGITVTCSPDVLAPGESVVCTADAPYVITAADVSAGAVVNTAGAVGTDPKGHPSPSNDDTVKVPTSTVGGTAAGLPNTGGPSLAFLALGGGLVAGGGLLLVGGRRRTRAQGKHLRMA